MLVTLSGTVKLVKLLHLLQNPHGIYFIPAENSMVFKLVHSAKAPVFIYVILLGIDDEHLPITKSVKEMHSLNAPYEICVTDSGIVNAPVKPPQPRNASVSIVVTEFGIDTLVKPKHHGNKPLLIIVTSDPNSTFTASTLDFPLGKQLSSNVPLFEGQSE